MKDESERPRIIVIDKKPTMECLVSIFTEAVTLEQIGYSIQRHNPLKNLAGKQLIFCRPDKSMLKNFKKFAAKNLNSVGLSVSAYNALNAFGFRTLGELVQVSERDLVGLAIVRESSMPSIREAVANHGLQLGMTIPKALKKKRTKSN